MTLQDQESVIEKLTSKAAGMFLWITLEGERIHSSMSYKQMKDALTRMPTGLHLLQQRYERSFHTISRLPEEEDRERACAILRWVIYALRPLTVQEASHAIALR